MIHTPIIIDFQGLTNTPSDFSCQDGELATSLNLINAIGELQPIARPYPVETFTLPEGSKVVFAHKVRHDSHTHTHYIIQQGNNIYWQEKASAYNPTLIYTGSVNSVTAIGNVLCFVDECSTQYAYWKESEYIPFSLSDLNYNVTIYDTMGDIGIIGNDNGSIFNVSTNLSEEDWNNSFQKDTSSITYETPDPVLKGASIIFNSFDALINKRMSELGDEWFKYLQFGVVAIRLYDGTYINISNPFVLAPNAISNKFLYLKSKRTITSSGYLHKHGIKVEMSLKKGLEDIVQGATVFITQPESFIDTTKTPLRINNQYNPLYNDNMVEHTCSAAFYFKEAKDALDMIDSMSYYRSMDIDTDEFGKLVQLKTISQVEESLSLADMGRFTYGGTCAITYNSRLHIGNVSKSLFNAFDSITHDVMVLAKADPTFNTNFPGCYINTHVEAGELANSVLCDAVFEVSLGDTMKNKTLYYKGKMQYPLPPIVSFPDTSASKLVIYLNVAPINAYYKVEMNLHKSNTCGMSYYIHFGDRKIIDSTLIYANYGYDNFGLPQFIQYEKFRLRDEKGTVSWWQDGTNSIFTKITEEEYNAAIDKAEASSKATESSPALIKVSEAENPLVFPAKDSVQVGSAEIQAIAANTRPISEGQFGEAPLYAFTDEGVWMMMLGAEGTYQSRQPVNRNICTDPDGILQIDDAVVYPTEQGVMLQEGGKSTCITEQLDGNGESFNFTSLPHSASILQKAKMPADRVECVYFRTFLQKAKMIFNYYDRRIILFNPDYSYAYVYCLKSQKWGMMESDFTDRVNIYPESYAINKNNEIVNVYNPSRFEITPYVLCTRPLKLGTYSFKTFFQIRVEGFFLRWELGTCGIALYGSNDLNKWYLIDTSSLPQMQVQGSPYKYFRIVLIGNLSASESLSGFQADIQERWQNKLR